jgi:hypothetical protein
MPGYITNHTVHHFTGTGFGGIRTDYEQNNPASNHHTREAGSGILESAIFQLSAGANEPFFKPAGIFRG